MAMLEAEPKGKLQIYSLNFNDADNERLNCYNVLKIYLED